jgi:hypothetical protein
MNELSTSGTLPRIGSSLRNPRSPRSHRTRHNLGSQSNLGSHRIRGSRRNLGSHRNLGSRRIRGSRRNHRIRGLPARRYQGFPYRRDGTWRG